MSAAITPSWGGSRLWPLAAVVVAALLRAAALQMGSGHLADDRDDYLLVARHYAAEGFLTPFVGIPSSFRPPLFPLVVAAILKAGGGSLVLGLVQLVLGTATVALTWRIGQRLGLGSLAAIAAGLVAVDPLLIEYTTFPMTETLFTFLVTLLVWVSIPKSRAGRRPVNCKSGGRGRPLWSVRPVSADDLARGRSCRSVVVVPTEDGTRARQSDRAKCRGCALGGGDNRFSVGAAQREDPRLARPDHHARRIHAAPGQQRGVLPPGRRPSLPGGMARPRTRPLPTAMVQGILVGQMDRQIGPAAGELAQDRWMYDRAWQAISASPRLFLRACLLRFAEFWNVMPLSPSRTAISAILVWSLAAGYVIELVLFIVGLASLFRRGIGLWYFPLLLVLNFTLVHLFYWSNMRMRAPLVPIIALVGAEESGRSGHRLAPVAATRTTRPASPAVEGFLRFPEPRVKPV